MDEEVQQLKGRRRPSRWRARHECEPESFHPFFVFKSAWFLCRSVQFSSENKDQNVPMPGGAILYYKCGVTGSQISHQCEYSRMSESFLGHTFDAHCQQNCPFHNQLSEQNKGPKVASRHLQ